jgi:holliday junction DNA helicase RuvB
VATEVAERFYPTRWNDYIGQENAKEQLKMAAASARIRKAAMEHTLIIGDTGVGKTALALLTSRERRTPVVEISGVVPISIARQTFPDAPPFSMKFWDEFHRIVESGPKNYAWLLHYLQDCEIKGPFGPEQMPPATILAATNHPELIPEEILNRFSIVRLGAYSDPEAAKITLVTARKVLEPHGLPKPSKDNARTIAAASNSNPRTILRTLLTLRDLALTTKGVAKPNGYDLTHLFRLTGTTPDGLDVVAQGYLRVMLTEFPDGAGIRTLKDRLNEPTLERTERVLVTKGYVGKTRSGRRLTASGIERAKKLAA